MVRPIWRGMAICLLLSLGSGGLVAAEDLAALMKKLESGDAAVQSEASNKLAKLGAPAVEPLANALGHDDKRVRYHAAWALKKIGKPAAQALAAVLAGNDAKAKYPAAYALADIEDAVALDAWLVATKDPDAKVRYYAVRALGNIKDSRAADAVAAMLQDKSPLVRGAAPMALAKMRDPRGVDGLAALMNPDVPSGLRFKAAFELWRIKDERAAPALIRGMSDAEANVRHHCAWALGNIQAKCAVVPLIETMEKSGDGTLKSYAATSLKQITGQNFGLDAAKWRDWLKSQPKP